MAFFCAALVAIRFGLPASPHQSPSLSKETSLMKLSEPGSFEDQAKTAEGYAGGTPTKELLFPSPSTAHTISGACAVESNPDEVCDAADKSPSGD
jgi:hypothetical protein